MTVINKDKLLLLAPIKGMLIDKQRIHGVSHGLAEAGYDIRIKQAIEFYPARHTAQGVSKIKIDADVIEGNFTIASAIEEFQMPENLVGIVHDKSTWARQGVSVFNTVIEPGWKGFLTLEIVFHGNSVVSIPAGAGIAQVIFHQTAEIASYDGKYQNQEDKPIESRFV